ncbi:hypothetical protein [Flavobacterium sp.]|uniref:hypothetical protein n=1 Tax=Flavobacterium sp. TaxID=239 RepID=UPI0026380DC2|nr:hypothetical protein [Flavobacterium sp.]
MELLEIIRNILKFFFLKKDEAIRACIKRNITLTDKNIKEVRGLIELEKKVASSLK